MANNIYRISQIESQCNACAACMNICPSGAIHLKERNGYFLFPEIEENLCNNCGLCKKVCPALKKLSDKTEKKYPITYGAYVKDENIRQQSTSGGAFSAIAEYVLNKNGYVCGAAFKEGTNLEHIIVSSKSDLKKFHGSKYIQSNVGFIYNDIKKLLNDNKFVLFVGTPCQVAGLKSILGKEYDNLITVDIFCHGVPPQKLFYEYINEITNGKANTVKNIQFRNKDDEGWEKFHISFDYEGGTYNCLGTDDTYFKSFRDCLILRKSCTNCKFASIPRQGDFTIGDFLALAEKELKIKDDKGVSTLIVNDDKAQKVLKEIKDSFKVLKKVDVNKIIMTNLLDFHSQAHANAERFREALYKKEKPVKELMEEYLSKADNIAILNWHNSHNNYGSVLTGYALKERIKQKIGYSPIHIIDYIKGGTPDISDLIDFTHEYIPETPPCWTYYERNLLNKYYQTFICGLDAVWRNMGFSPDFYMYLLNFANTSKNISSYAPSFGLNRIVNTTLGDDIEKIPSELDILERKRLMKRFNHISVREDSGIRLCKEYFDVEAEHVLDAVFLLRENDYQKLIDTSELESPEHYFARYIINQSCVPHDIMEFINNDKNMIPLYEGKDHIDFVKYKDLTDWKYSGPKCVDWLKLIQGCDYLVTDSYHGMCFAIIFKKQFVLTKATFAGCERQESLLKMLGITDNRFASSKEEYEEILNRKINYEKVYENLDKWIAKSEAFLDKVLVDNKHDKARDLAESLEIKRIIDNRKAFDNKNNQKFILKIFGIPIYTKETLPYKIKYKILGVPILKIKNQEYNKNVYILGIPLFKLKPGNNGYTLLTFMGITLSRYRRSIDQ